MSKIMDKLLGRHTEYEQIPSLEGYSGIEDEVDDLELDQNPEAAERKARARAHRQAEILANQRAVETSILNAQADPVD